MHRLKLNHFRCWAFYVSVSAIAAKSPLRQLTLVKPRLIIGIPHANPSSALALDSGSRPLSYTTHHLGD